MRTYFFVFPHTLPYPVQTIEIELVIKIRLRVFWKCLFQSSISLLSNRRVHQVKKVNVVWCAVFQSNCPFARLDLNWYQKLWMLLGLGLRRSTHSFTTPGHLEAYPQNIGVSLKLSLILSFCPRNKRTPMLVR